jgi:hypothetical protein
MSGSASAPVRLLCFLPVPRFRGVMVLDPDQVVTGAEAWVNRSRCAGLAVFYGVVW